MSTQQSNTNLVVKTLHGMWVMVALLVSCWFAVDGESHGLPLVRWYGTALLGGICAYALPFMIWEVVLLAWAVISFPVRAYGWYVRANARQSP